MNDINNNKTDPDTGGSRHHATIDDLARHDTSEINHSYSENRSANHHISDNTNINAHSNTVTTVPDMPGQDATIPDASGQSTTSHDMSRHSQEEIKPPAQDTNIISSDESADIVLQTNQKMDNPPNDAPRPFADWVDIETTDELLREEGITRTIRTIQRMCKRGDLAARLVPTENGVRYLIERGSIYEFVERHNQIMPSGKGKDEVLDNIPIKNLSKDSSEQNAAENPSPKQSPDIGENATHLKEVLSMKDEQLEFFKEQLNLANDQLRVKDEQIITMLERDHETNILIQNLQQLMGLPSARNTNVSTEHKTQPNLQNPELQS